jgi:tol-pal system protein YbgF
MLKNFLKQTFVVAVLSSFATFSYAEDAPVFDLDSMAQQFDGQPETPLNQVPPSEQDPMVSQQAPPAEQPMIKPDQPIEKAEQPLIKPDQPIEKVEQQSVIKSDHPIERAEQGTIKSEPHPIAKAEPAGKEAGKVNQLQNEVQTLRGQVEELTHQLQQLQTQQKTMYADLDKRVTTTKKPSEEEARKALTEKANDPSKALAPKPVDTYPQPSAAEEQQTYQTVYEMIKAKKYNEGIAALQKMLQKFPSGAFAGNAHYWLGEVYSLAGKFEQSANEFSIVVKNFPNSSKVSVSQLKLGTIYASQSKWSDAKSAYRKVINQYPGTASAHLASQQLKQIKLAGH